MKEIQYFKSMKNTHRFRKDQKVWISYNCSNHLDLRFKWRGCGRWVKGRLDKYSTCLGKIKTILVEDSFFDFINLNHHLR